ncbi:MAG: hypothetical protein WAO08_16030 [Hyphomicrobiaceae bacterium]
MTVNRYNAAHWRQLAAEAELVLCEVTGPQARFALNKVVAGYLLLARHADRREERAISQGPSSAEGGALPPSPATVKTSMAALKPPS